MSQIPPFIGSILQAPQVQRQQAAEKEREAREASDHARDTAESRDKFELHVESSEEVTPIHDRPHEQQRFKRPTKHKKEEPAEDEDQSHLDLKA